MNFLLFSFFSFFNELKISNYIVLHSKSNGVNRKSVNVRLQHPIIPQKTTHNHLKK